MPERLTPGVYVDEISGGIRPIEGVGTSTAGFIGEAARGIPDRPTLITGFGGFQRAFGGHRRGEAGYLAQAVDAFFENGGRRCFVTRVLPDSATMAESLPVPARDDDAWGLPRDVLRFRARGEGAWAGNLRVHVVPATSFGAEAFGLRIDWVEDGRSRTVERFDNLRMDPEHEDYVGRAVDERSQYIEIVDLVQAELDAEVPANPPLPETVAGLDLAAPAGTFDVVEGATLAFRWTDAAGGADDHAATLVFPDDDAALTADAMTRLLIPALGPDYRVLGPVRAAALVSAAGPFDVSGGNPLTLTVDGNASAIAMEAPAAARLGLGAGPFAPLVAGFELQLTVNGTTQSYTLVAGDVADAGTGATRDEVRTVVNREFTDVNATLPGGQLRVETTATGAAATLSLPAATSAVFGDPGAETGRPGIANLAAATAEELAAMIAHAIDNTPYAATAAGGAVRLQQVDMADHTLTVTATTAPDAVFPAAAAADGPVATGQAGVRVEPAVATRVYRSIRLLDGEEQFLAAGVARVVTVTVTSAGVAVAVPVNMAADGELSPTELADAINAAAEGAAQDDAFGLTAEATAEHVTLSADPAVAGITIAIAVNGAAMWREEQGLGGVAGAVVAEQSGVEISVSEPFLPGIRRVSGAIFPTPRNRGRRENSALDPNLRPAETDDDPHRLLGGTDGTGPVSVDRYRGTITATGRRTGLRAFEGGPIAMLAIPGRNDAAFISMAMGWAGLNDVFLIVDGPGSLERDFETSADSVRQWAEGLPLRSNNACTAYPWIQTRDPVGAGRNPTRFAPPSGHVAGIYARTDINRGVWKAGAGIEASVNGSIGLQHRLVDADQDLLNPVGVNCIRRLPGAGIIMWGARTLAADAEWRYVPVRRTALFLKRSLRRGLQWAVFEPNDQDLWDLIRINVSSFMLGLFQQGAFQGATPEEAFFVQCDRETNPQVLVDQGIVTVRVGFAALKPAEFVVVELQQINELAV